MNNINNKIGIAPIPAIFIEFYVNIAKRLESENYEVYFLNPDKYNKSILKKKDCKILMYPEIKDNIIKYGEESDIIEYIGKLYAIRNIEKLIFQKNKEYSAALCFFKAKRNFSKILFWNGAGNVEKDVCKGLYIPCLFFENGYLPNTLQVDVDGVNCDSSYSKLSLDNFLHFSNKGDETINNKKIEYITIEHNVFKRFLFRLFDSKFNGFVKENIAHNIKMRQAERSKQKKIQSNLSVFPEGKFIFFPLQVNTDTQIILNSKYRNMYDAIEQVLPHLKKYGYKILLKEHPSEVEKVDYGKFIDNKDVFLIQKGDISQLILKSEFVVCINSSVGFQALMLKKHTVYLGKVLYSSCPIAIKFNKDINIIEEIEKTPIDQEIITKYFDHFKENIFIEGNWRHSSDKTIQDIASIILR